MYLANLYDQVQESGGWTEAEVSEVTYIPGFIPAIDMQTMEKVEQPQCEPGVVLRIDQKGCMAPMATGVMVVKDVAGRACSRVLRVLYGSGGSKSMMHKRVLPTGVQVNQD